MLRLHRKEMEDAEDINAIKTNLRSMQEGREIAVPGEVTFAILDGANPIMAWREYKQIK